MRRTTRIGCAKKKSSHYELLICKYISRAEKSGEGEWNAKKGEKKSKRRNHREIWASIPLEFDSSSRERSHERNRDSRQSAHSLGLWTKWFSSENDSQFIQLSIASFFKKSIASAAGCCRVWARVIKHDEERKKKKVTFLFQVFTQESWKCWGAHVYRSSGSRLKRAKQVKLQTILAPFSRQPLLVALPWSTTL